MQKPLREVDAGAADCYAVGIMPPPDTSAPSLDPLLECTRDGMEAVNRIITTRMQSEIELIPALAGHLVLAGGKRIRPVLTMAAAQIVSRGNHDENTNENAARLAAAVEFIHTATLLHDDVIDESGMRRGKQSANIIWGNEASVLVGDFLFARAFELMVEAGNITVLGGLATAATRITEGEIRQMLIAGKPDTAIADYMEVITGKTAELFAAAAKSGAVIAGGDADAQRALHDYGMALGIAFQITDDALDYRADDAALGKNTGDDFAEGKITLPVMVAWQKGNADERAFWMRCLSGGDIREGDLDRARDLLAAHDAIEAALAEARGFAGKAEAALSPLPQSKIRDALIEAARFAVARSS